LIKFGWYMVCYDIANPSRLGKVHRLLRKKGISVQKSIFFIQHNEKEMNHLLDKLAQVIKRKEDDIRAYPVERPDKVWTTGGILETYPLVMPGGNKIQPSRKVKKEKSLWQRLLGK